MISMTFQNIYGAGIRMEPQDIFDLLNPQKLFITQSMFQGNTPYVGAFIDVYENSELEMTNSEFKTTFSIGSGSIVLANYKDNKVYVANSTFVGNYAILGGVFYA